MSGRHKFVDEGEGFGETWGFDPSPCDTCVHRHLGTLHCAAYPDTPIPIAIANGSVDHRKPFTGDHGIRYEPIAGADPFPLIE